MDEAQKIKLLRKIERKFDKLDFPSEGTKAFFTKDYEVDLSGSGKSVSKYANLGGDQFNIRLVIPLPDGPIPEKEVYVYFIAPCVSVLRSEDCVINNFSVGRR